MTTSSWVTTKTKKVPSGSRSLVVSVVDFPIGRCSTRTHGIKYTFPSQLKNPVKRRRWLRHEDRGPHLFLPSVPAQARCGAGDVDNTAAAGHALLLLRGARRHPA